MSVPTAEPRVENPTAEEPSFENDGSTTNDLLLAQMLQLEFDKENDEYVKSLEKNYNGTSKGICNFNKNKFSVRR